MAMAGTRTGAIDVRKSDRWLIVGATGSGKTTFARRLLKEVRAMYSGLNVYVLDSKGVGDFDGWPGLVMSDDPPAPLERGAGATQVWQPGVDDFAMYDDWFGELLKSPDEFILLIDELSSVTKKNGTAPDNFQKLMKQGRGKNKSVANCTQELAYISRQVVTQTTHIVRFLLVGEYDPRVGNRLVHRDARAPEPNKYGFYYARVDKPTPPTHYRSLSEFF